MEQGSSSLSTSDHNDYRNYTFQPKNKVFLSHSGAQKEFVEQLCVDLERCDWHPFFDKRRDSLPIGKEFPKLIFEVIEQCEVGVVVLSEEFFISKWPMLELVAMANVKKRKPSFTIMPILLGFKFSQCRDVTNHKRWLSLWHTWAESDSRIDVKDWENALQLLGPTNALKYNLELGEVAFRVEIVEAICKLVPPRTRFEDSHVQGRSRLCKVIHKRIQYLTKGAKPFDADYEPGKRYVFGEYALDCRPGMIFFLNGLTKRFCLAVWTRLPVAVADPMVAFLFRGRDMNKGEIANTGGLHIACGEATVVDLHSLQEDC